MKTYECKWGFRTATVRAKSEAGARNQARKTWGKTARRPEDREITVTVC